jgi:putative ABC transport system permease protein
MERRDDPPKILEVFLQFLIPFHDRESLVGDFEEMYARILHESGIIRALFWYTLHIVMLIPAYIKNKIYWTVEMIKNYLKITFRNIQRHKFFSFINIAGLAIGMACAILILLWVKDELSYDRFHENAEEIYRVLLNYRNSDSYGPNGPGPLGPALREEYPEIVNSARFFFKDKSSLRYKDKIFTGLVCGTDHSFFEMFTFPFIKGDPKNSLSGPSSIVLTEGTAKKFFGSENPVGKTLGFEWVGRWYDYTVTGVVKDVPLNSHIQFDFLLPLNFVTKSGMSIEDWDVICYYTYVLVQKGVQISALNEKIANTIKRHLPESQHTLSLQPLTRIHLYGFTEGGPITYVYIFSTIAILILFVACINFMNLSTARSTGRAKEVGMRKVVGSNRLQLIKQFLGESLFLSFIALIFALMMVNFLLPLVNNLLGKELELDFSGRLILSLIGIAVLTGISSGSYPALFLSSFQPSQVLKGTLKSGSKSPLFRRVLVVTQFAMTTILIISAIIAYKQLTYIKNRDLGFNKECIVNMELKAGLRNRYGTIKRELLQNPNVLAVSATNASLSKRFSTNSADWEGKDENERMDMAIHSVDFDYLRTFGLEMAQGRYFSKEFPTDISKGIIVNETAVKMMRMEAPIGKRFFCPLPFNMSKEGKIIGVVKDFHFRSLHRKIEPLILVVAPGWFTDVYVKLRSENLVETMVFLERTLKEFASDFPFEYSFLNEDIDRLYKTERRAGILIGYGSFFAVFIACLGLFGLASFTAEQRTKEIGIRKVLGASVTGIVALLTKEFTRWVLIANVVAWPIAYFAVSRWLQNFAYRTSIEPWIFLVAGMLAMIIALITVSYQSIKAAVANPVDSLRYE